MPKATLKSVPDSKFYKHWKDVPESAWRWPHFTPEEIACRGTGEIIVDADALDKLEALRVELDKPVIVNSGYRSVWWNKKQGGVANSQHLKGKAFDVSMLNHEPNDFEVAATKKGFTGIGHYPKAGHNFMHIDTGPKRRWNLGGWFPRKPVTIAEKAENPTPQFTQPEPKSTVIESVMKPEVLAIGTAALGSGGLGSWLSAQGPVATGAGIALVIVVAVVAVAWLIKRRNPPLND